MEHITKQNILGVAAIIIAIIALFLFNQSRGASESISTEEVVTQEEVATTTLTSTTTETEVEVQAAAASTGDTQQVAEATKSPVVQSNPAVSVEQVAPEPEVRDLGPRQPATTPVDALKYAAEAARQGDIERTLSYISVDVRDGYRTAFTNQYKGQVYPSLQAHLVGTTDPVELIQPEYGLYRISVYGKGATLPFHTYYRYDGSVGEFVITEL